MKKLTFLFLFLSVLSQYSLANLPAAPSGFKITNSYTSAIMLKWDIASDNQNGFILERSNDGITWDFTKYLASGCTSFFDVGLIKNNEYFYRISAVNNEGKSDFTKTIAGVTVPTDNCIVGTDTVSVQYPFYTYFTDSRTQILYLKNEVYTATCPVTLIFDISFYITELPTNNISNFSIKMQNTTDTVLSGFVGTNWTTVYSGTLQLSHTGWHQIYLNPYFIYDHTKNLLMDICFDMSSYSNSIKIRSSQAPNKVWHYHLDNASGCSLTGGTVQAYRPNIKFSPVINTVIKINDLKNPEYKLEQNYPNPFNGSTKFRFSIKKSGPVTMSVYDIMGRQEVLVFNEPLAQGEYEKVFSIDKYPLPSGIYYYCLSTPEYSEVKKMVILK